MKSAMLSDQALLEQYKQGDSQAISQLLERHSRRLRDYVRMMVKDNDVAEDLVQEILIKVVKVIDEYEAEADGTRALAKWDSAIVIKVTPNDTGYGRNATLSAKSFTKSDRIIIRQPAMAEE